MINMRLLNLVKDAKKYIIFNVGFQIIGLLCNIFFLLTLTRYIVNQEGSILVLLFCILIRMMAHYMANWMSFLSSVAVKIELREILFTQVLLLGHESLSVVSDSELTQLSGEGIEQLELYFSNYIPQFFYSMIAPLILFVFVVVNHLGVALVLLVCVPLIPVSIVFVQRFAKKILNRYWGIYTGLGDSFLDSVQGILTLKLFQYDAVKQADLEAQSETFRKVTMRVLLMQLNSISIMDLVAYGGAMLAIVIASVSNLPLASFLFVILVCADFFIPMRLLGSYFHVAMNGASAAEKIFRILDHETQSHESISVEDVGEGFLIQDFSFSYTDTDVLQHLDFSLRKGEFVGLVGMSGSGKSTLSNLLMKHISSSNIRFANYPLQDVQISDYVCLVSSDSTLFKGTVRDVLRGEDDAEMIRALAQVNLDFGLDYELDYLAANISGGQRQRLALARALIKDADFYILDEVTSAVDFESESIILSVVQDLVSAGKGILMISHRLYNVERCDRIYVLDKGILLGVDSHSNLYESLDHYREMVDLQKVYEVKV